MPGSNLCPPYSWSMLHSALVAGRLTSRLGFCFHDASIPTHPDLGRRGLLLVMRERGLLPEDSLVVGGVEGNIGEDFPNKRLYSCIVRVGLHHHGEQGEGHGLHQDRALLLHRGVGEDGL